MNSDLEKEYHQYLLNFHNDRFRLLSGESVKCSGCENNKELTKLENKLIYNCGESVNDCGTQYVIKLAQYVNYDKKKQELNNYINGKLKYSDDINNLYSYNLEELNKYINVKDELEEQREKDKIFLEELIELDKLYIKNNELKELEITLQNLNNTKNRIDNDKQKILKQLKTERDIDIKKQLRRKYAEYFKYEKTELHPLLEIINKKNENYILIKDPEIEKINETYKEGKDIEVKTKKTKVNNKNKKESEELED